MNRDRIDGEWKRLARRVRSQWARLTDLERRQLRNAGAKKDALVGKVQERYGFLRDEAERQVDGWIAGLPAARGPFGRT
jgi:uncharacterized protein YjbJ (UPF0337 family)